MFDTQSSSEVVFNIAEASFNWWFCWPMSIILLGIIAITTVGYALCDSLPDYCRGSLQRLALISGSLVAVALLFLCGLLTFVDWLSFRRLQNQAKYAELTEVEGTWGIGRYPGPGEPFGSRPEPRSFKIVDSQKREHFFAWKLTRSIPFSDVEERINSERVRVKFVPNPKHAQAKYKVEQALILERLSPTKK